MSIGSPSTSNTWYADSTGGLNPAAGITTHVDPSSKTEAYSWLKAPRNEGLAYETGALARMVASGLYPAGKVSVNDRHLARAYETLEVAEAMLQWQSGRLCYRTACRTGVTASRLDGLAAAAADPGRRSSGTPQPGEDGRNHG